jgi:putative transposase
MRDHDISQRRACRLVSVDPKTVRRQRPPDCPEIRKEMKDIADVRRRFGYRRIGVLLERKGMIMNHKKLYRLYCEEGLSVKRRRGRKRARGSRSPMPQAAHPNARWSLDFLSDSFGASRKFRVLAVIDDCCRENLCLIADTSISGARVARELDALVRLYEKPSCIVSDNGTEFTSRAILQWADWRYDYNNVRPHSSLGNKTPNEVRRAMEELDAGATQPLAHADQPNYQSPTRRLSN